MRSVNQGMTELIWFLVSCVPVFAACLFLPQYFSPEQDLLVVPFALAIGLVANVARPGTQPELRLSGFLIFALLCILLGRWHAGVTTGEIIAGRLPFNDASAYLRDAAMLPDGSPLSPFSSRRPIHVLVLAAFLKLAHGNFAIASVWLLIFAALAITGLATAVRRSHGNAAAIALVFLSALYYRRFVGTAMSEHAGFIFGCVATTLLWRGAETRSLKTLCGGVFLLTVALVARAGCFFVLPALVLWTGWITRRSTWPNWQALVLASGSVALGFVLNSALLHLFGTPGSSFANFPITFYGLIVGGNWQSFAVDYPDIAALSEAQAAPKVMAITLERLSENPWLLGSGAMRAWRAFFGPGTGEFSFLHHDFDLQKRALLSAWLDTSSSLTGRIGHFLALPSWPKAIRQILYDDIPWVIFTIGGVAALSSLRAPRNQLIVASFVGVLASIPFNPPWDADSMRTCAATMPLQMMPVVIGMSWIAKLIGARSRRTAPASDIGGFAGTAALSITASLPIILALIWIFAPQVTERSALAEPCPTGSVQLVRALAGTELTLTDQTGGLFPMSVDRFRSGLTIGMETYPETFAPFETLPAGTTLFAASRVTGTGYNVIAVQGAIAAAAFRQAPQPVCISDRLMVDARATQGAN